MSCNDDSFSNKDEKMDVIGSQANVTPKSDRFLYASSCAKTSRPRSAAFSFLSQNKGVAEFSRPKSADFSDLNPRSNSVFQYSSNCDERKVHGGSFLSLSHFTVSSSKLLLHLLKEPDKNTAEDHRLSLENNSTDFENFKIKNQLPVKKSVTDPQTSNFITEKCQNDISNEVFLNNDCIIEWKKENSEILDLDSEVASGLEERLIRFLEPNKFSNNFSHVQKCAHHSFILGREKFHDVKENNKNLFFQKSEDCQRYPEKSLTLDKPSWSDNRKIGNIEKVVPEIDIFGSEIEKVIRIENSDKSFQNKEDLLHDQERTAINYTKNEGKLEKESSSKNDRESSTFNFDEQAIVSASSTSKNESLEKRDLLNHSFNTVSSESAVVSDHGLVNCHHGSDFTYDEIIQLLQTLKEENKESYTMERKLKLGENSSLTEENSKVTMENLNDVFAYLEEIEKDDNFFQSNKKESLNDFISPSLEKLLNKTSVELAHEVLSLEIQIEDQKKGIILLKDTIADLKEAKRIAQCKHQETLFKTNSDAEALVKRHQKFIKQLLNEKKNLSETVSKLVQDLKSSEEKHRVNIKAMEEKLLVEVKKARDTQAVADKIKREKWMEMKTRKIKEMTVKGLEPELTQMATQQQQELTELRNLHRAEIEAIELKAARRTSELLDRLRIDLTKEKENAITNNVNSLRTSMEREFEEERNKFHHNCQCLKQRIRKLEEKLSSQEEEFHLNLMEAKQEMEKEKQKLVRIHQENLDELKRKHSVEMSSLEETLDTEKQLYLRNLEKQLTEKFLDKEMELHEQYKRERDREIELVIENLEKEQAKAQAELDVAGENKLKRIKEKLEGEIKEWEVNVTDLKAKLSFAKSEVLKKEEDITQLKSEMRQLHTEISFLRKSCEKMISEKTQLKETIRCEFENSIDNVEKENKSLQKEILNLKESHLKELVRKDQLNLQAKNEMQKELTSVYSRIKAAISKKEKIIEALREENKVANERYRQLELMLDKQRKNLLLQ